MPLRLCWRETDTEWMQMEEEEGTWWLMESWVRVLEGERVEQT